MTDEDRIRAAHQAEQAEAETTELTRDEQGWELNVAGAQTNHYLTFQQGNYWEAKAAFWDAIAGTIRGLAFVGVFFALAMAVLTVIAFAMGVFS